MLIQNLLNELVHFSYKLVLSGFQSKSLIRQTHGLSIFNFRHFLKAEDSIFITNDLIDTKTN